MVGIDTNVLVRFLVQDDPAQFEVAKRHFDGLSPEEPGLICREVLVELVWVLSRAYGYSRADIAGAVGALLESQEVIVEDADRAAIAVERYARGHADFADHMIALAHQALRGSHTITFDRKAGDTPGFEALR